MESLWPEEDEPAPVRSWASDLFAPPLAITSGADPAPSTGPQVSDPPASGTDPTAPHRSRTGATVGRASVATALPAPAPGVAPVRPGYGLGTPAAIGPGAGVRVGQGVGVGSGPSVGTGIAGATGIAGGTDRGVAPAGRALTRLDRRVQLRRRRRADDEFVRAGRAELLSDDARYRVLFTVTAAWYAPAALLFVLWVLADGDGASTGARLGSGLLWLAAAAGLSLAVAGLLRWATVGWRAVTLSLASAVIGGAVVAIASTLSG